MASAGDATGSMLRAMPTPTALRKTSPAASWFYRDWVVDALNRDLGYDRFVVEPDRRRPAARCNSAAARRHGLPAQLDGQ